MIEQQDQHTPVMVQVLATTDPDGQASRVTLELLGDAVPVARRWNGSVGVWLLTPPDVVPAASLLAAHGCSLFTHLRHERFRHGSSEAIAASLHQHVAAGCRLILLPGHARGEEVAALLAERLETLWVPDVLTLSVTRTSVLEITATLPGGKLARTHRPVGERPVVVTMRPGVAEAKKVDRPTPVEVRSYDVDLCDVPALTRVERSLPADPKTVDLVFARRIVSAGRGTGGPEGVRLVAELADALGASLGASRMVVDLGWLPLERQVGQTGRTVRPDLYVACGISGASHHQAGMRESKHIVAINSEASAAIHDIAHLSLRGDLHRVIPAIHAVLERRLAAKSVGNVAAGGTGPARQAGPTGEER
jgi:electron transfer flavoprotein alpha subunit